MSISNKYYLFNVWGLVRYAVPVGLGKLSFVMDLTKMNDVTLSRWSGVLLVLAVLTGLQSIFSPLSWLFGGTPIILTKGDEIWRSTFQMLPRFDAWVLLGLILLPQLAWVAGVWQVGKLAHSYRRGILFDLKVTQCYMRMGAAWTMMGVLATIDYPVLNYVLYWDGVTPWVADMPLLEIVQTDLIMAGAFFFVLGKIMRRGVELQDSFSLTV